MSTIQEALVITVNGIVIVFSVLVIIMLILYAMKLFAGGNKTAEKTKKDVQPAGEQSVALASKNEAESKNAQDEELIAVLSAAVAASMGLSSTYHLNIKSYRKIENRSPVWNAVSRRENIEQKL